MASPWRRTVTQPLTPPQADLVRAIRRDEKLANANQWVLAARPIIRAMFAIEDIQLNGLEGEQTRREARGYLSDAYRNLEAMLDGIRDEFLCDERVSWNPLMGDLEAAQNDEFNDWLDDNTTSARDAIKAEVEQFNASWSAAA
jgi:hypothetical protein